MNFETSYLELPERFYTRLAPSPVANPRPIRVNRELADRLGIDANWLESPAGTEILAGNRVPEGSEPIATVYAGHQFGGWVPQLGDGRAILLGEMIGRDGNRYDVQLKGSGRTPYSRGGDGRAPLGPVLREYIVSEAMAALGVPTSRALAAVTTGETVYRERREPGAVLTRVAQSHIRIGTFQYFLARQDVAAIGLLASHVIERHYPEAAGADNPVLAMYAAVITAQAELIARWQMLGFIHGVMNTDNMLLSGETIDYGPCAFMDTFHPETVFSSIDQRGRYAYRNQPGIAHWNLACLAQALLPVIDADEQRASTLVQEALDAFPEKYQHQYRQGMARKLCLSRVDSDQGSLAVDFLELLAAERVDFTLAFRRLTDLASGESEPGVEDLFEFSDAFAGWLERWQRAIENDPVDLPTRLVTMKKANPAFIPRNHLVAEAIEQAVDHDDFSAFHRLVDLLSDPRDYEPDLARFAKPPRPEQVVQKTFCGT